MRFLSATNPADIELESRKSAVVFFHHIIILLVLVVVVPLCTGICTGRTF